MKIIFENSFKNKYFCENHNYYRISVKMTMYITAKI